MALKLLMLCSLPVRSIFACDYDTITSKATPAKVSSSQIGILDFWSRFMPGGEVDGLEQDVSIW
jgi:hypothetical protein